MIVLLYVHAHCRLSLLLSFTILVSTVTATVVYPDDVTREGNCNRSIDAYLCRCLASNTTIDIQISPGNYTINQRSLCTLQNKTSVKIIGSSSNDTIIRCANKFSIQFFAAQHVVIHNLIMVGCGSAAFKDEFSEVYAFNFDGIKDLSIANLYMLNTIGYGIVISNNFGPMETIELSDIHITSSAVDNSCMNYDFNDNDADFSCSGSGLFILLNDNQLQSNNTIKVALNDCLFANNINILPTTKYDEFLSVANTGYQESDSIPLVGAACISVFYLQETFNVTTKISNTRFINNNGTFSGSVAIVATDSFKSRTIIDNCTFNNNKGIYESSSNDPTIGGIYFINLERLSTIQSTVRAKVEVLTVMRCNFLHLAGRMGVAFHIEKNSPDSTLTAVKVEQCNFTGNAADSGSAIFAKDRSSRVSYREGLGGSLNIHLININAEHNVLSPNTNIKNVTSNFVTGIFHVSNCLITLVCNLHCQFQHNQPSVFYGHRSALKIDGDIVFLNNTAKYGGALRLLDTVLYINTNTVADFKNNYAVINGGAIKIEFAVTNIQSQDNCPIQFVGLPPKSITDNNFRNISRIMNISVIFQDNYVGAKTSCDLESIFASVFYVCSWYPDTSVQTRSIGPNSEVENGFRDAVYRRTFNYSKAQLNGNNNTENLNYSISDHLNIFAIIPCVCDEDKNYNATQCLKNEPIDLSHKVVPGRPFVISVTSLDTVGSIGYSTTIESTAYRNISTGETFILNEDQITREFTVGNERCIELNFTVYFNTKNESLLRTTKGNLTLSIAVPRFITISFSFVEKCPIGFVLDENAGAPRRYACICDDFLTEVINHFSCDQDTGLIRPTREGSWLAAVNNDIQYIEFCSPTLCDYDKNDVNLDLSAENSADILCGNNHKGRGCGDCANGYSRVFGSDSCKKCSNAWLTTILLYAILGIILIVILILLKLTVTVGIINGLVFFCNVMSINEKIFFNENISKFSFVRLFISVFNLDLGFELCFYDGMNQVVKTGLQYLFPIYLWPLIVAMVYLSRWSHRFQIRVSRTSVPAFATLILLSYVKLLRTVISVFSIVDIKSSMNGTIRAWRPDPSVNYLEGGHIILFVIAVLFLLFIFPFAISFAYPKILHYKKFSFLYPFFDSFVAPYKEKYRFWFGIRALVLIYLAIMETIIFADIEALLLSSIIVVGTFTIFQAYIRPFKDSFINIMDLAFTGNFLLISSIVLYLNPTVKGYKDSDIVVNVLGTVAFLMFCIVIVYHIHFVSKKYSWYINASEKFWRKIKKYEDKKLINAFFSADTIHKQVNLDRYHVMKDLEVSQEEHVQFQEPLFEKI